MADKYQALYNFWSGFGLAAYDENSVPSGDESPDFPYITYSSATGKLEDVLLLSASLWYKSPSWEEISLKALEIEKYISEYGHRVIRLNNGFLFLTAGTPFAQRMGDPDDDRIKRILINVMAEFLTAY